MKSLGRFFTTDAPLFRDQAQKKLVCNFVGQHFVAEREGNELRIFALTDEFGNPAHMTEDRSTLPGMVSGSSPADVEHRNRKFWGRQ